MKIKIAFLLFVLFVSAYAQNDSITKLDEIVLKGSFSPILNSGYSVEVIGDSLLESKYQSLGNLLQSEANFYFKQNGNGMVSSIALRGSNASQTGVYWNGIGINSSLNGQTDFNALSANSFDEVEIRKGGGSVLLGSGAVGGAINLKDIIAFRNNKEANVQIGLGSYDSYSAQFKGVLSNENLFAKISFGALISANDYPFLNTDLKNENGEFKNFNIAGVFGYKINKKNQLIANVSIFDNDRNNSRTLSAESNSKLLNTDSRFLLNWKNIGSRYSSSLKVAYLNENFTYFFNQNFDNSSKGSSNNFIVKHDFTYFLNQSIFFNSGLEFKNQEASGTNISTVKQNDFTAYILFHHQPIKNLNYNASVRKGFSSVYEIPFIFAFDASYDLGENFVLKANCATNYRLPTFNDLYWEPGGNLDLKVENSNSAEFGFAFIKKAFEFNIASFYIKSKNLIQWQPISNTVWQPINIQDVNNYGIELSAIAKKKFNYHLFRIKAQYDYTISDDENLGNQLIYVPYHKANANLNYNYKDWSFNYNLQFTGEVFITTSNTQTLNSYWLSNVSIQKNLFNHKLNIAFLVNNVFNENYESVAYRPMPNRNFTLNLNLKI